MKYILFLFVFSLSVIADERVPLCKGSVKGLKAKCPKGVKVPKWLTDVDVKDETVELVRNSNEKTEVIWHDGIWYGENWWEGTFGIVVKENQQMLRFWTD